MNAEADPTDAANDLPSSPVQQAIRQLLAYASQSNQLAAQVAAAAMGRIDEMTGNSSLANHQEFDASPPSLPAGEGWGEGSPQDAQRPFRQPSVSGNSGDGRIVGDSPSPPPSPGGRGGAGVPARFESLEGLYQRIAASAAGGGSDEQASKASVETARNTSLILQALEAQNRLLENGKAQQQQPILWQ
jgi:hypothetical protein